MTKEVFIFIEYFIDDYIKITAIFNEVSSIRLYFFLWYINSSVLRFTNTNFAPKLRVSNCKDNNLFNPNRRPYIYIEDSTFGPSKIELNCWLTFPGGWIFYKFDLINLSSFHSVWDKFLTKVTRHMSTVPDEASANRNHTLMLYVLSIWNVMIYNPLLH